MGAFFLNVFNLLKGNFSGMNANFSTLITLIGQLAAKSKSATDKVALDLSKETQDRQGAIDQETAQRNLAIQNSEQNVLGQVDTKINPIRAELDLIKAGTAKIVKLLINPNAPTQTVVQLLTAALGNSGESIVANRTYLLEFIGNVAGEQSVDNMGAIEMMSSGEKYLIHTDNNGAVATAEVFSNPVEEVTKDFVQGFGAIKTGLEETVAQNAAALQAQALEIAALQQAIAAY